MGTIQRFEMASSAGSSGFLEIRSGGSLTTNNSDNTYVGSRGLSVLTIESGATLNIGPGPLYVGWRGDAGAHGDGTVIQNGGTVTVGRYVDLAREDANTEGRYEIHDGTLTIAEWLQIGRQGTGTFVQTDGIVTVNRSGDAVMVECQGDSTGTYTMSNGELRIPNGHLYLGQSGNAVGTFTQSGGTVLVDSDTVVGGGSGTDGTLSLGGDAQWTTDELFVGNNGTGVLNVADTAQMNVTTAGTNFRVGNGANSDGTVNQTGGTVTQPGNGAMYLGYASTAIGRYNISGGVFDQGSLTIGGNSGGTGIVTQSGGDVYARRDIRLGRGGGGDGTYNISGGTLHVTTDHGDGGVYVGRDSTATGAVNQSGGTVEVAGRLVLGNEAGNTGTYDLADGVLDVDSDVYVGLNGTGTFTQQAGTVDSQTLLVARNVGAQGDVVRSGGTWTTQQDVRIGVLDEGSYTQEDGTVLNVGARLLVGDEIGGDGTLVQNGGTIDVPSSGNVVYVGRAGTGHYTINDGELNVPNGYLYVGGQESSGDPGDGTVIQNGGDVTVGEALRMAAHNAGAGRPGRA